MKYKYTIRKLNHLLGTQQTLNATGRDSLAPGRVAELANVIELLKMVELKDGHPKKLILKLTKGEFVDLEFKII